MRDWRWGTDRCWPLRCLAFGSWVNYPRIGTRSQKPGLLPAVGSLIMQPPAKPSGGPVERDAVSGPGTGLSIEPSTLYVVATPIGHRDDISRRAVGVLAAVDAIAAEDTRHTRRLLGMLYLPLEAPLISLHEHNERERVPALIERLRGGEALALVSDAGTPGISDPGYPLVVAAHAAGIRVVPIPGPTALVAALAASGQPTDRFVFEGFLPARARARQQRLQALATEARTLVLYESGHRIEAALRDLAQAFGGERAATLARELTKVHETMRCATLDALADWVASDTNQSRGEIVLVVAGASDSASAASDARLREVLDALLPELAPSRAASVAARLTGISRRAAYRAALDRTGEEGGTTK